MVMVAMQNVRNFLNTGVLTQQEKNKPVCHIFKKGPEKQAAEKNQQNIPQIKIKVCVAMIQHITDYRNI